MRRQDKDIPWQAVEGGLTALTLQCVGRTHNRTFRYSPCCYLYNTSEQEWPREGEAQGWSLQAGPSVWEKLESLQPNWLTGNGQGLFEGWGAQKVQGLTGCQRTTSPSSSSLRASRPLALGSERPVDCTFIHSSLVLSASLTN